MRFPLQSRIPRRQAFLLLIAILVPCLVLVALGLGMIEQERQLEAKRINDDHLLQVVRVREELMSLLEKIKRQQTSTIVSGGDREKSAPDLNEAVAFNGVLAEGRLQLSWEENPEVRKFREWPNETGFADAFRNGEAAELRTRDFISAVAYYRQAIKAVDHLALQSYARLKLARALEKSGLTRESRIEYERVLALPPDVVDEHGIPLALYAAPPLLGEDSHRKEMLELIGLAVDRERRFTLFALYMARDLARKLETPELEHRVSRAIRDGEWAEELQRDSSMLARLAVTIEPIWIPYGDVHLLVAATPPVAKLGRLVVAVRTDQILSQLTSAQPIRAAGATDTAGEPVGESFPGLRLVFPPPEPQGTSYRQLLLAFAVILALAFAILAGYFVQRDVQRSLRLAELRSQFVSSVTHELKTPLTAVRMFTETLRLDEEVDRQTRCEYLDTILHESERLSRLVDNVLDFGNIERGKKTYRFKPVRLDEVVERATRAMQYPLEQAGFVLDVAVEDDLPPVAADSDALEQAILNLLANAMKYSGDSRKIRLAVDRRNRHARIHVEDHGIGIAPSDQGRIFERFYRVTTAENQHVQGTGLGLTLAVHIAKAHGGDLDVESSVGVGSTFTIRLPLPESETV